MKGFLPLLIFAIIFLPIFGCAEEEISGGELASIRIQAPEKVNIGSEFTALIEAQNLVNFDAASYTLVFDPEVLKLLSVEPGEIGGVEIPVDMTNEIEPGKWIVVQNIPGISGASGSGILAVLHFEALDSSSETRIDFEGGVLSDTQAEEIPAEWEGAEIHLSQEGFVDITPQEAWEMLQADENIMLLDVRTKPEYDAGHIPGCILIPLSELESRLDELDKDKTIIVYCRSGRRSRTASQILVEHGFTKVYNVVGGILAWKEAGLPVEASPMIVRGKVILQRRESNLGAEIFANERKVATTDADGNFSFEIEAGTYVVKVVYPGYLPATKSASGYPGDEIDLGEVLLLGGDLDGDGVVDVRDLVLAALNLGQTESTWTSEGE